jgi:hypothetical protein
LRGAETILKDSKYRGNRAQRNDLFQGPGIEDYKTADISSDDEYEDEEEEAVSEESSDMSNESGEESAPEDDLSEDEQDGRREKVREMLARETQYQSSPLQTLILGR